MATCGSRSFQTGTGPSWRKAIEALQLEHGPLQGLVLDLRNNPGGVLQASVDVADAFLTDGLIVYTKGRQPAADSRFRATGGDLLDGAPVAVLINEGSASAAEIVAGALQDHRRALVLGSTSYGKGSVQAVLPLDDKRALKLTTALLLHAERPLDPGKGYSSRRRDGRRRCRRRPRHGITRGSSPPTETSPPRLISNGSVRRRVQQRLRGRNSSVPSYIARPVITPSNVPRLASAARASSRTSSRSRTPPDAITATPDCFGELDRGARR